MRTCFPTALLLHPSFWPLPNGGLLPPAPLPTPRRLWGSPSAFGEGGQKQGTDGDSGQSPAAWKS